MNDTIFIRDLRCRCIIGVDDQERLAPQEVVLGIELKCRLGESGISDSIEDTVDYRKLVRKISENVAKSEFQLLEALCRMVAQLCLEELRVTGVIVQAEKPGVLPDVGSVGVRIECNSKD